MARSKWQSLPTEAINSVSLGNKVNGPAIDFGDFGHFPVLVSGRQHTEITRLPTTARIKGCPVQNHTTFHLFCNHCLEGLQIRIRYIKQFTHRPLSSPNKKRLRPLRDEGVDLRGTTLIPGYTARLSDNDNFHIIAILLTRDEFGQVY
jgi:hypothetical protein